MARAAGAVRRKMDWYGALTTAAPYGAIATVADGATSVAALIVNPGGTAGDAAHEAYIYELGEQTLTRIRGDLSVTVTKSANITQGGLVYFGIIISQWEAFDAGVAALPSPFSDPEADWLYWRHIQLVWRVGTLQVWDGTAPPLEYQTHIGGDYDFSRVSIDSKAQRKLRKGELPVAILHWRATNDTPSMGWTMGSRCLLKL